GGRRCRGSRGSGWRRRHRRNGIRAEHSEFRRLFDLGGLRAVVLGWLSGVRLGVIPPGRLVRSGFRLGRLDGRRRLLLRQGLARPAALGQLLLGILAAIGTTIGGNLFGALWPWLCYGHIGLLGMHPAAPAVELLGLSLPRFRPCFLFGFLLLRALFRPFLSTLGPLGPVAADSGIARTIGDEIGGERAGHVGARGVVLAEEARQRRRGYRLQQATRTLMADAAGAREKLGRRLAGVQVFLRQRRLRCEGADQKQHRRETERSARHS